jgi:predicted phage tail protein
VKRLSLCLAALALNGVVVLHAVPAAPGNLQSTVNGNSITLSWTAPPGVVLGYRLEAGTAPGLNNIANSVVGVSTTFSATGVPAGTYYVRVRAIGSDGDSAVSNEVVVAIGAAGCATAPNAPTNFAAAQNAPRSHSRGRLAADVQ